MRDEAPFLLEARIPQPEASEDIDASLEVVSRPHAGDKTVKTKFIHNFKAAYWIRNFLPEASPWGK
jgi:hypothetical protein